MILGAILKEKSGVHNTNQRTNS